MKIRGPLVTLGAVAVLGAGILLVNISQHDEPAPAVAQSAVTTLTVAPAAPPPPPATPPPPQFPAKADYVGKIPTATGHVTVEITVQGDKAVAYACDGNAVESWLWGSARAGVVSLTSKDKSSRLDGHLEGTAIGGSLRIGEKKWDFTAPMTQPPAGLYVYENAGVRNSWIVDPSGGVTGVQRAANGSTAPAPRLTSDGMAVIDGISIKAIRVQGDSDV